MPYSHKNDELIYHKERRAIIVLGMHRSGTSALTRILNLAGASLPSNLLPKIPDDNHTGYWESRDIVEIHDDLLESAGFSWDDISSIPNSFFSSTKFRQSISKIIRILERDFLNSVLFVIKDPRVCRLVPLWLSTLEKFNTIPLFVITIRHPLEVAASLNYRKSSLTSKSLLLWLRHFIEAEYYTRGYKRCFTTYDELMVDHRSVLYKIGRELNINWPCLSHFSTVEMDFFITTKNRHYDFSSEDINTRPDIVSWVKEAYNCGIRAAQGDKFSTKKLDDIRTALDTAVVAFGPIITSYQMDFLDLLNQTTLLTNDLKEIKNHLNNRNVEISFFQEKIEYLHGRLNLFVTGTENLQARILEYEKLNQQLSSKVTIHDEEVVRLVTELHTINGLLANNDSILFDIHNFFSASNVYSSGLSLEISSIFKHLVQRDNDLRDCREQIAMKQDYIDRLKADNGKLFEKLILLEDALNKTQNQLSENQEYIIKLLDENECLHVRLKEKDVVLNEVQNKLLSRQNEIELLCHAHDKQLLDAHNYVKTLEEKILALSNKYDIFRKQYLEKEQNIDFLTKQISDLQFIISKNKHELSTFKGDIKKTSWVTS